jgi:hypothetical protein
LLLSTLRHLLCLLTTRHLLLQLCQFAAQLFLLTPQALKLSQTLFFRHVLHSSRQVSLRTGQTLLASGQLFQAAGFFVICLCTTSGLPRCFVSVFILAHLHVKQLAQVFSLLLTATTTAATRSALEINISAIDFRLSTQNIL